MSRFSTAANQHTHVFSIGLTLAAVPAVWLRNMYRLPDTSISISTRLSKSLITSAHSTLKPFCSRRFSYSLRNNNAKNEQNTCPRIVLSHFQLAHISFSCTHIFPAVFNDPVSLCGNILYIPCCHLQISVAKKPLNSKWIS